MIWHDDGDENPKIFVVCSGSNSHIRNQVESESEIVNNNKTSLYDQLYSIGQPLPLQMQTSYQPNKPIILRNNMLVNIVSIGPLTMASNRTWATLVVVRWKATDKKHSLPLYSPMQGMAIIDLFLDVFIAGSNSKVGNRMECQTWLATKPC